MSIPVRFPEKEILARLKYNIHKTEMDDKTLNRVLSVMKRGFSLCEPKGSWFRDEIESIDESAVRFSGGLEIRSGSVARLLRDSHAAVFFCATVGREIVSAASESMEKGEASSAVIYDAVGSETAEASVEWINAYIASVLRRRGEHLTSMRYSPGYGDFLLENQREFFELLKIADFGVTLSERFIFSPEKTVTAIAGIEKR